MTRLHRIDSNQTAPDEGCHHFWCDSHLNTDHMGMRRDISATADPDYFVAEPSAGGVRVPSVSAMLTQNGGNDRDPLAVALNVYAPGSGTARETDVNVYLTLTEAQALRNHLSTLLESVEAGERPAMWPREETTQ